MGTSGPPILSCSIGKECAPTRKWIIDLSLNASCCVLAKIRLSTRSSKRQLVVLTKAIRSVLVHQAAQAWRIVTKRTHLDLPMIMGIQRNSPGDEGPPKPHAQQNWDGFRTEAPDECVNFAAIGSKILQHQACYHASRAAILMRL